MIKVLIVDDEKMIHNMLRSVFEKEQDLKVIGAVYNGEEAVKFVRQNAPDVITMDVNMPVMNGLEATRKITAQLPQTIIIGLSFQNNPVVIENMFKAGASAYLTKDEASVKLNATIRKEGTPKK